VEFDRKVKVRGFILSHVDPCVYMHSQDKGMTIVTIWVDDLLIFTSTDEAMQNIKQDL